MSAPAHLKAVPRPLDIAFELAEVAALNDLALYIARSREFVEGVQRVARQPAVAQALKDDGVAINAADFAEDEQSGLEYLHIAIGARLQEMLEQVEGGRP